MENRFFFCHQLMSAPLVAFSGCHSDDVGNVGTGATLWVLLPSGESESQLGPGLATGLPHVGDST